MRAAKTQAAERGETVKELFTSSAFAQTGGHALAMLGQGFASRHLPVRAETVGQ